MMRKRENGAIGRGRRTGDGGGRRRRRLLLLPFFTRARLARYNRPVISGCAPLTRLPCDAAAAKLAKLFSLQIVARTRVGVGV